MGHQQRGCDAGCAAHASRIAGINCAQSRDAGSRGREDQPIGGRIRCGRAGDACPGFIARAADTLSSMSAGNASATIVADVACRHAQPQLLDLQQSGAGCFDFVELTAVSTMAVGAARRPAVMPAC